MSYPTEETLQYAVTPAQESVAALPHVPSAMHRVPESYGEGHFALHSEPVWRVDSYRPAPKIVPACRLQKAARFVFAGPAAAIRAKERIKASIARLASNLLLNS
jgi:hypothetical protein